MENKRLTGYPSIDKPWLKYYSDEAINEPLPKSSLYEYIYQNNKNYSNDVALIYFNKKITYGELFKNIDKVAEAFSLLGINNGDVVSIISITTPEFVYAFYALNKIGAIVNMIDPRIPVHVKVEKIKSVSSKFLIVLDECLDNLDFMIEQIEFSQVILLSIANSMGFPIKQVFLFKKLWSKRIKVTRCISWNKLTKKTTSLKNVIQNSNTDSQSALIEYTGGTTGESKGVVLTNRNINSIVGQYRSTAKAFNRQQSWLTISAPFIAYALITGLHMPLVYGMQCHIELYDPDRVARSIVKNRYNHVAVTPIVWEKLIHSPIAQNVDFSFLIAPTSGADYMSLKLENEINDFFASHNCKWKICQGYGMTEVSSGVSVSFSNATNKLSSVGIPLVQTIISTFDVNSHEEKKIGELGEVCICGPSVMLSYINNSDATKEMIIRHTDGKLWLHTGDLGYIDEDGFLFISGRIKRMITRQDGFKVFPAIVEEKILSCNMVEACSVVGKKDTYSEVGQVPVAFIVVRKCCLEDKEIVIANVNSICGQELPQYAQPEEIIVIESLPLTSANKIDYRFLEQMAIQSDLI